MKLTVEEILKISEGELLNQTDLTVNCSFSTDTRKIKPKDFYVPLKGVSFDGENFIQDALNSGAVGAFTTKEAEHNGAMIKVENPLNSYLKLCKHYLNQKNPIVIGITGSCGKTTTKEILYSVLSEHFRVNKTYSNHNNEIGFCETVNNMTNDCEVLIVEMGMRGLGEIELISQHARPDYGIITNVGSSHLGRLKTMDNIAIAKCELSKFINPEGKFYALDQELIKKHNQFNGETVYYSSKEVDIVEMKSSYTKFRYKDREYELSVEGLYNVENSIGVIELAYTLGMEYPEVFVGLKNYKPIEKRWEVESIKGYNFINDSYNASPESMIASVSTFVDLYENSLVILGDMFELGEDEAELHSYVGKVLSEKTNSVTYLTVGELSKHIANSLNSKNSPVISVSSNYEAARYILENANIGINIFLKASRGMKLEEIMELIRGENLL